MNDSLIKLDELLINDEIVQYIKINEFHLFQDDTIYTIILKESENELKITYKKYIKKLNLNEISTLTQQRFNSIHESFEYVSQLFEDKKISIKGINTNISLTLSINLNILNNFNFEEIEINLEYNNDEYNSFLEEMNNIFNNIINNMKDNMKNLVNQFKKIEKEKNVKIGQSNENPKDIKFGNDIAIDSFANFSYEDSFTVFHSINNILQLIYATKNKSIISYDLNNKKVSHKLFNCHNNFITSFRHYLDKVNNRDIIMSISKKDNNLKLWNANTWENICNLKEVNRNDFLYSASFLSENNNNYIITSNGCNRQQYMNLHNFELMKIYNFNGEKIKELPETNDCTFFVDIYYDKKLSKNFIITGNYNYIKSYDYDKGVVYHKYFECNNGIHPSVIVKESEEKIKIIESCEDGIIRIWGFHSGNIIRKIQTDNNNNLYGICLWNDNYAFVGCKDQTIKLIELKNGLLIKTIQGHNGRIISFKKIIDKNEGEYLLSQGLDQKIKLWINKKNELN